MSGWNKKHVASEIAVKNFKEECERLEGITNTLKDILNGVVITGDTNVDGNTVEKITVANMCLDELVKFYRKHARFFSMCEVTYKTTDRELNILKVNNKVKDENIERLKEEINSLNVHIEELKKSGVQLLNENNGLRAELQVLLGYKEIVDNHLKGVNETYQSVEEMMEVFKSNVKTLQLSEHMKTEEYKKKDRHGEKSPAYRKDVNTSNMLEDYKAGMPVDEIANKYKVTYQTVKNRLQKIGEWKHREN